MNWTFYWLTGEREVLEGDSPADCLRRAGYGAGAVRALDFFYEGVSNDYVWDSEIKTWVKETG